MAEILHAGPNGKMKGSDPYDSRRLKQSFHGFWALFHFEGVKNRWPEKKCFFLKIDKEVNFLNWFNEIVLRSSLY